MSVSFSMLSVKQDILSLRFVADRMAGDVAREFTRGVFVEAYLPTWVDTVVVEVSTRGRGRSSRISPEATMMGR